MQRIQYNTKHKFVGVLDNPQAIAGDSPSYEGLAPSRFAGSPEVMNQGNLDCPACIIFAKTYNRRQNCWDIVVE